MADLETLTLQIETESRQALTGLDKLANRLSNLSAAVSKLEVGKLNALSSSLTTLNSAITSMNASTSKKDYNKIIRSISDFGKIDTGALINLANSLSNLNFAFFKLGTINDATKDVASLVSSIGKLGGASVQKAIKNMPQLEKAFAALIKRISHLPKIQPSVIAFTDSLANLASKGQKVGTAAKGMDNQLKRYDTAVTRSTRKTRSLASAIGKMYAEFWIAIRAAKGLKEAFMSAADYLEAYNYFDVTATKIGTDAFREAGVGSAEAYATAFTETLQLKLRQMSGLQLDLEQRLIKTTNAKSLGLNLTELTQYQAAIASITNAMGVSETIARSTSKAFSMLAADMSSLRNVDFEQVASNLQSALAGQARAIYKYGIDITQATLETYAYNLGIKKSVSEMTQAEKAQLRLIAILDQSKVAWGDLAHTINSPANQLRQLQNNLKEVGIVLGQLFVPMISGVLPYLNGLSIALKQLLVDIAGLLGIKLNIEEFGTGFEESIENDLESVEDLNSAMKETKKGIREFDELKVIGGDKSLVGGNLSDQIDLTKEILEATNEYERVWDEAYNKMKSKAQEIGNAIRTALEPIKEIIGHIAIGDFFKVGEDISSLTSSVFKFVRDAIDEVDWEKLGENIGDFFRGIKWSEIFKNVASLVWSAIQGAFDAWNGAFDVAPFETAIITAFSLLKFTTLGKVLTTNIGAKIKEWFVTKGVTQEFLAKAGLGSLSIGLGVAFAIDNVKDVQVGKYAALSFESLTKTAISSLLTGAGFASVASAMGLGHIGLVFAATAALALAFNIISAKLASDEDVVADIVAEQYKWVEESHIDTIDVLADVVLRRGEVDTQFLQIDDLAEKVYSLSLEYDNLTDGEKGLLKYYSDELIKVMPELANQIDGVTGAYKGTREELDRLIEKQKEQMLLGAYGENMSELASSIASKEKEYQEIIDKQQDVNNEWAKLVGTTEEGSGIIKKLITWGYSLEEIEEIAKRAERIKDNDYHWVDVEDIIGNKKSIDISKFGKYGAEIFDQRREIEKAEAVLSKDLEDLNKEYEYWQERYKEAWSKITEDTTIAIKENVDEASKASKSRELPRAISDTMDKVTREVEDGKKVATNDMKDMFEAINNSFFGLDDGKVPSEVQSTMDAIKSAIETNSPELVNLMAKLKLQMEEAFANTTYTGAGDVLWNPNGVVTRIDKSFNNIEEALDFGAKASTKDLEKNLTELFGGTVPKNVSNSLDELEESIKTGNRTQIVDAIKGLKKDVIVTAKDLGMNIDFGVAGGVYAGTGKVATATSYMVKEGLVTPYKEDTESNSPSRLFKRMGKYVPEGTALGIVEGIPDVKIAMNTMASSMSEAFKGFSLNVPQLNASSKLTTTDVYGKFNNPTLVEQFNSMAQNNSNQTEVVFRVEGDPHGLFKVVQQESERFRKQTGRSL